ncbi:hypothetical protein WS63_03510 [Burkholderia stagnalis]|uniref:hypothetical protein n=1 Tax=Burkholderia stagnalis TaxID=1503054 RepID=UPI0007526E1E|nr:hypothetical protein [Burkholderia stagnalis]KVD94714.1 hypothetical protein WS63_03510 [Burkholderia stagnalis]
MTTADTPQPTHDDRGTRAPVPSEYRSSSPARLRDCVRRYRDTLPADVVQALLDAARALEASEEAFAAVVDQKHALQRQLAQTESDLPHAVSPRRVLQRNASVEIRRLISLTMPFGDAYKQHARHE